MNVTGYAPAPRTGQSLRHGTLSVVVPCYNEESVIATTHERLDGVLKCCGLPYEVIYVDDGSRDRTDALLQEIARHEPTVHVVTLARNFGHQAAASAGLQVARGDAVAIIDADLQDPPEVLLEMLDRWHAGVDVAYGRRKSREGETIFKLFTAKLFYRLLSVVAERPLPLDTGDFRLMDRAVVDCIVGMPEQDRFLRGMVAWVGFRQEAVSYVRAPRLAGETKYPFRKMMKLAVDAFISLSHAPVRLLWWITGGLSLVAGAATATACLSAFVGWPGGLRELVTVAIVFSAATANAICLTIIGEYASRVYRQVRGRPLWIVHKSSGAGATPAERPGDARLRQAA